MAGKQFLGKVALVGEAQTINPTPSKILSVTENFDGNFDVEISNLTDIDGNFVLKDPSPETSQTIQGDLEVEGDLKVNPAAAITEDNILVWGGALNKALKYRPIAWLFNLVLGWFGWATPQKYGAVGDGISDDTAAIQQCVDENNNIFLYSAYKTTAQIVGRADINIYSNNATIRNHDVGERTIVFAFVSGFSITGKLKIIGNGKADGSAIGLFLAGCSGFSIQGLTVTDMAGRGIHLSGEGASRGDRGSLIDISLQDNWIGLETDLRSEYHTISNINAGGNQLAVSILSGNIIINGGSISDNDAGVYIGAGDNNSHGMLVGLNINHNTNYNLKANNITYGQTIIGCHFYGTATENIIIEDSKGLNFTGCFIDGLITNTDANTPKGTHLFTGCTMLASTSFSGSGKDVDVLFNKNTTLDGGLWSDNTEFFDSTVIHTTGDESKTGAFTLNGILTLNGLGLNLTKYQVFASDIGYIGLGNYAISGGSSTAFGIRGLDSLQLSGGTDVDMTIIPNGNVLINTSVDSGTGAKLQVNGEIQISSPTLSTSGATKGYVDVRAILNLTNVPFTLATINALYPAAQDGDRIVCPKVNTGTIYTKAGVDWVVTSGILLT